MAKWLSIVGIGEDGLDALTPAARGLIDGAEILVGGERHFAMLPNDGRMRLTWPSPLLDLIPKLLGLKPKQVCVLATGDPMQYGIGVTLAKRVPIAEMTIVPSPSAFALACAQLGWDRARVDTLTLHGRPIAMLNAFVQPGARILALSDGSGTPLEVAKLLAGRGFGDSRMTVLEHMGGDNERILGFAARDLPDDEFADFNTVAIDVGAGENARFFPRVPGLPDDAFANDGQLTKREVRAATLAALGPGPGQHLWDIGAGCGSVAIEWLRACRTATATAIESNASRIAMIAGNAAALGVPNLRIVHGTAPDALPRVDRVRERVSSPPSRGRAREGGQLSADSEESLSTRGRASPPTPTLPLEGGGDSFSNRPDAVFIGGGLTADGMFDACWRVLRPGGRLVANAVTAEGEQAMFGWHGAHGGDLTRIAVSHLAPVGRRHGWKPLMTVTQYAVTKS